ncbi:MAG: translesion error-prone DNA polymerase V autoproteolytic subunit [Mobiluncus sp.]|uniref:Translesion error-prone DNA polymerase V autoproteolytic subunit n=1 Tax=Mobiluncus porci TaxID=2652278 RepID=A0A7K0K5J4_9ACTO|nr:translesion error-prone DNA polymerase V autoproteolytic subunit [Mobiluncus sp.]MCI6584385.1 translesion error-prone DNA polymerase V autoproteolytic subunit [Mobiluncus sp.]MST50340.1 translesion error-prone DNA polymerase V autoproteolytic subunit [Mobiluncus porci]
MFESISFGSVSLPQAIRETTAKFALPVAPDLVPAGWPSPAQDYFDGDIDLNEHLIRNKPATFVVRVAGDSMIGAGISDGDELIVDRSLEPGEGSVVIAVIDGELTVKRLRFGTRGPELHPENSAYPVLYPHELSIWGVVTRCLHRL